jgi:hypothetical protein
MYKKSKTELSYGVKLKANPLYEKSTLNKLINFVKVNTLSLFTSSLQEVFDFIDHLQQLEMAIWPFILLVSAVTALLIILFHSWSNQLLKLKINLKIIASKQYCLIGLCSRQHEKEAFTADSN